MPEISRRKNITSCFRIDNKEGDSEIGYDMIIGYVFMLQLGLMNKFIYKSIAWDDYVLSMKETRIFIYKPNLTKREMWDVVIQTAYLDSTI